MSLEFAWCMMFFMMNFEMNAFVWNCRGVRKKGFSLMMKDLKRWYDFFILVLLETHISGVKADTVVSKLGFDDNFLVSIDGFAGGIWGFLGAFNWPCFSSLLGQTVCAFEYLAKRW